MNRNNYLGKKPSTRVHHAPGGQSNFSLSWNPQEQKPAKPVQAGMAQHTRVHQGAATGIPHATAGVQQGAAVAPLRPPKNHCHATAVRNFTRACGQPTPNAPQLMNRPEVEFITKMVLDELLELNATVMSPLEAKQSIANMLRVAKDCPQMRTPNKAEIVAE